MAKKKPATQQQALGSKTAAVQPAAVIPSFLSQQTYQERFVADCVPAGITWHISKTQLDALRDASYLDANLNDSKDGCACDALYDQGILDVAPDGTFFLTDIGNLIYKLLDHVGYFAEPATKPARVKIPKFLGQSHHVARFSACITRRGMSVKLSHGEIRAIGRKSYLRTGGLLSRKHRCACIKLFRKGFLDMDTEGNCSLTPVGEIWVELLTLAGRLTRTT